MSERTVEYEVSRTPQMGEHRNLVRMPELPAGMEPELHGEHMLINIGPQHPATHGVLRLVLELDGEVVIKCVPHIGYLHSSFEKIGEYRTWNQIIPLTDRMDYLAPLIYNCAYAMAVEKLMGVTVTERCKVVRVICMELDRIFSHLLWLGTTAIDIGAFTVFLWTFQERERIYDLHESFTGARITTSATRIGGMMADLPVGWIDALQTFINNLPRTLDEVEAMLTNNGLWVGRNVDIGTMSADDAIDYGLTGPNLRATGVPYDLRKDRPYYDYETYEFDVIVGEKGDNFDRYLCRMEEMRQSLKILQQAIDRLPEGPINVDDPRLILPGKTDAMLDMESMIHHFKVVMEG
ncbi:MAG TPA: NADH-quinone oxidoreductase subunit D, partial [Longimicrobiales bacterium]|nr:NADH-quinone oxidoreductase subunit D [Longimicrobiales bacterium]